MASAKADAFCPSATRHLRKSIETIKCDENQPKMDENAGETPAQFM